MLHRKKVMSVLKGRLFLQSHFFIFAIIKMEEKKKQRFWDKIRNRYRLVVLNDDTFEEQFSFKLTPLNIVVLMGLSTLAMITLTVSLVAFTPLREYIPGYGTEIRNRKNLMALTLRADSLQYELSLRSIAFENLKQVVSGNIPADKIHQAIADSMAKRAAVLNTNPSKADSVFRSQIESQDKYSLPFSGRKANKESVSSFFFFTPVKGMVSSSFNASQEHYGVDIVANENEPIKATLEGTVLFAGWTTETGNTIQLQHANNLVSIYKHNSVLLKKIGQFVKAGEAIAVIGNSGEQSTGAHLHFEIWQNGSPINPQEYIVF
jgi:murein DD-endopeptidase MepM/ murein hydrolase activator NlpD